MCHFSWRFSVHAFTHHRKRDTVINQCKGCKGVHAYLLYLFWYFVLLSFLYPTLGQLMLNLRQQRICSLQRWTTCRIVKLFVGGDHRASQKVKVAIIEILILCDFLACRSKSSNLKLNQSWYWKSQPFTNVIVKCNRINFLCHTWISTHIRNMHFVVSPK